MTTIAIHLPEGFLQLRLLTCGRRRQLIFTLTFLKNTPYPLDVAYFLWLSLSRRVFAQFDNSRQIQEGIGVVHPLDAFLRLGRT